MSGRHQMYRLAGIPSVYWDVKPRAYVREEGLTSKFEGIVEACGRPGKGMNYGVVVESRDKSVRPAFTAAILKFLIALHKRPGNWRTFTYISSIIRSTKFDYNRFEDNLLAIMTHPPGQIVAIDGMSSKVMATVEEDEKVRMLDMFERLFQNGAILIISTSDNQDRFEKMLGEDLSQLLSDNLGTWGKLE